MLIPRLQEAIHFYRACGWLSHVNTGKCATRFCTIGYFKYSGKEAPFFCGAGAGDWVHVWVQNKRAQLGFSFPGGFHSTAVQSSALRCVRLFVYSTEGKWEVGNSLEKWRKLRLVKKGLRGYWYSVCGDLLLRKVKVWQGTKMSLAHHTMVVTAMKGSGSVWAKQGNLSQKGKKPLSWQGSHFPWWILDGFRSDRRPISWKDLLCLCVGWTGPLLVAEEGFLPLVTALGNVLVHAWLGHVQLLRVPGRVALPWAVFTVNTPNLGGPWGILR